MYFGLPYVQQRQHYVSQSVGRSAVSQSACGGPAMQVYRIARRNFGGQNFGGFAKNRFWQLIFWRIDAKADIHAHVYPILAVKILAFREQSAKSVKILTTKISRYTVTHGVICIPRDRWLLQLIWSS